MTIKAPDALVPTVNLNGTDAQALAGQYHDVAVAARALASALALAHPNGRDWQTRDPDEHRLALEHWSGFLATAQGIAATYDDVTVRTLEQEE